MQDEAFPTAQPNTFRDSNDTSRSAPKQTPLLNPHPIYEPMDFSSAEHLPIEEAPRFNGTLPPFTNPLLENQANSRAPHKSIVRPQTNDDDDDDDSDRSEKHRPHPSPRLFNGRLIDNSDVRLEAAGYDTNRLGDLDADAAFALQLQQEEYSRDSMLPMPHRFMPFDVDEMDGTASRPLPFPGYYQFAQNDEAIAAYMQSQEARQRQRQRPPIAQGPPSRRTNPQPSQGSERNGPEVIAIPPFLRSDERRYPHDEEDSDDGMARFQQAHMFFHMMSDPHRGAFHQFLRGHRGRHHRRGGNLQETEDDFGPEDYERLLQLDDTINKKKITKDQINAIPIEKFSRPANKSDEENQCGICLERFEENEALRRFPCAHLYHQQCADRWLQENNVCPICREPPVKVQPRSNSRPRRGAPHGERSTHRHTTTTNTRPSYPSRPQPSHRGAPNHRQS